MLCALLSCFAVPPPPAVAATPPAVRPVAPTPAPTPLPSTTPTPSTQPAPAPAVSTTTTPPTETESKSNTAAIVGGVVGGVAGLALIGLVAWVFVSRSKKQEAAAALVPVSWWHRHAAMGWLACQTCYSGSCVSTDLQ